MFWYVSGTVEWSYESRRPKVQITQATVHGHGRRAWGPFPTEAKARLLAESMEGFPGFSDLSVIQGVANRVGPGYGHVVVVPA